MRALREGLPAEVMVIAGGAGAAALRREIERAGVTVLPSLPQLALELRAMARLRPQ